jgi:cytochrome c peroxidase
MIGWPVAIGCTAVRSGSTNEAASAGSSLPVPLGLGMFPPILPVSSPITRAKIDLGRDLFFEKRLSRDGSLSCASCHIPANGFAEPVAISRGIGRDAQRRNTLSVVNSVFQPIFDWDGRAPTLEDQLSGVFAGSGDMGIEMEEAVLILRSDSSIADLLN